MQKICRSKEISKIIQRPPKIYLDANHLINIVRVRKGETLPQGQSADEYRCIEKYLRSYCGLIFNLSAALEWVEGRATAESAREIAAVVDSAKLKYILEADYLVYTREALDQCRDQNPNIRVPDFPVLQNLSDSSTLSSALGILISQVPDYLEDNRRAQVEERMPFPTKVPVFSAQQWAENTLNWKQKNPETFQKRIDGFRDSLSEDIEKRAEYFSDCQSYQKGWMKGFLKIDRILRAFNPLIDIDGVLDGIDATECSAVNLYWKVREKRMKSGNRPQDNDVDDYMSLPVVPYGDIVLTERNLRTFILQADKNLGSKVFHNVTDALDALDRQGFAW